MADTMTRSMVEVRSLRCRYGDHEAVTGIDLDVREGEIFALLGTNGAGKTTTLETLEGHRRADAGRVRVLGRDPYRQRREIAAKVGVMFQESGLPDTLTAAETVRLWGRLHRSRRIAQSVEHLLERVDLAHRRDVPNRQLSGGERRRLDLALAVSTDPYLLFLDEPTTGLDPESRARTWRLLRELHEAGTTIVLTTHYLDEAEALAGRLAIMDRGDIAIEGTLEAVIGSRPAYIRCRLSASLQEELPSLRGQEDVIARDGLLHLEIATREFQRDLTELLTWARRQGVELHGLTATEASLAQVFHELTDQEAS